MIKQKAFWGILVCVLMCLTAALADSAYVNGQTADRVHLRKEASTDSESLGLFYTGTKVAADETKLDDEWVKVSIGSQNGYIMGQYLQADLPDGVETGMVKVSASSVNLRAKPTKDSKVLKVLMQDELMTIWGHTANDWYYVQIEDGATGYVMPEYTSAAAQGMVFASDIRRVGDTHNGYHIFSYTAPNGQNLYFTGYDDPFVQVEDVNFDGHDDLVFTIIRGASNFFVEFFVWSNGEYVHVSNDAVIDGLVNYSLLPEQKLVMTNGTNGLAGMLHDNVLFRWEGTELKKIRRAISEENEIWIDTENGFTIEYETDVLRVRVWDYLNDTPEEELIYEQLISTDEVFDGDSYEKAFAGEKAAFWQGIR